MQQINTQHLLLLGFKRIYVRRACGSSGFFYFKSGLFLKGLSHGYYKVLDDEMQFMGTVKDLYRLQLLLIVKECDFNMN